MNDCEEDLKAEGRIYPRCVQLLTLLVQAICISRACFTDRMHILQIARFNKTGMLNRNKTRLQFIKCAQFLNNTCAFKLNGHTKQE